MSLSRIVLRMLAVRAITGKTLAGNNVNDSAMVPIEQTVAETALPIITVVTDDDMYNATGREMGAGERSLDLVIEVAVASSVSAEEIVIPHTDFGLEWSIDIIEHQIDRALFGGETPASQAFMRMIPRAQRKASRRGSSAEKGVRYAARQIVYTVEPLSDPQVGRPLDPALPFGAAIAMIEADDETADFGAALRAMIEQPSLSPLAASIMTAAMTAEGAEKTGIADLGDGHLLTEVIVQGDIADYSITEEGEP